MTAGAGALVGARGRCAVTLALLLAVLGVVAAGPSSASPGPMPLQVPGGAVVAQATLTGVQPAYLTPRSGTLTLRGILRNVSDSPLVDPVPALRWSLDALQSPDELDLVTADPLFRYGRVDYASTTSLPTLQPGRAEPFTLRVPLAGLLPGPGVYVVGVDVLATLPDGLRVFVASARTTVVFDVPEERPLPVALLWPLATDPSLLPSGALLDDALAAQLAPGGRLDSLVTAPRGAPVTWVVDPDLVATAAAMSGGYETVSPPGPGAGAADASRFLATLGDAVRPPAEVRRLPAADPDVGGLLSGGWDAQQIGGVLAAATRATALADVAGRDTPLLAMLAGRRVDDRTLASYRAAAVPTAVLSSDDLVPGTTAPTVRLAGHPGLAVVPAVTLTAGRTPGVLPALAQRQRVLAVTALAAAQPDRPTGLTLAPTLRWQPSAATAAAAVAAWREAPWVRPVTLTSLPMTAQPATLRPDLREPRPLDPAITDGLASLEDDLQRLAPLFATSPLTTTDVGDAEARATSSAWIGDPDAGVAYVAALQRGLTGAESQVSLVLSDTITLSSRSGRFPVTLVNDSAVDVIVGVRFTSQNSTRLRVDDAPPTLLSAGEKRTVTAVALATANGRVVVTADLVTTEGQTVGTPATTVVDVTNVGALGWVVIAAGGVLLAAALLRGRLRRPHDPDGVPEVSEPAPDRVG